MTGQRATEELGSAQLATVGIRVSQGLVQPGIPSSAKLLKRWFIHIFSDQCEVMLSTPFATATGTPFYQAFGASRRSAVEARR